MKVSSLLVGLILMTSASTVMASGPYVGASGGLAFTHDGDIKVTGVGKATASYDPGFAFNLSAGYNFDGIRVEGEFGYKKADVDEIFGPGGSIKVNDTDITMMSYMINGYYDIKTSTSITPFFGLGLGLLNGELQVQGSKEDDMVFGYQLTAGISCSANKYLDLDLLYRYQGAASDFTKNGVSVEYNNSNFFGGIRYKF